MLSKSEVIKAAKAANHLIDESNRVIFKTIDYTDNPLSPENTAYRLFYTDLFGVRRRTTYYPNTVGFQGG